MARLRKILRASKIWNRREWAVFASTLWKRRLVLAGILVVVFLLHWMHFLEFIDFPVFDRWQRLLTGQPASYVRIVSIENDDFRELFGERIPLDPQVIGRLLDVIAAAGPRAIGVDLNTAPESFATLAERRWGPVVWARNADQTGDMVVPTAVLGGRTPIAPARAGIALAALDSDTVIRRFPRTLETAFGPRASFHWAIVQAACERPPKPPVCDRALESANESGEDLLVNLYRKRLQLGPMSARDLLKIGRQLPSGTGPKVFEDRVVLLGGRFKAGKDFHTTPIGELAGVEIWAHAIETELADEGVRDVGAAWLSVADASIAVFTLWVHHFLGTRRAFLFFLATVPAMIVASLFVFRAAGLFLTFSPVGVAILLERLYDDWRTSKSPRANVD